MTRLAGFSRNEVNYSLYWPTGGKREPYHRDRLGEQSEVRAGSPRRVDAGNDRVAFQPGDRLPLLAGLRRQAGLGSAAGDPFLRRSGASGSLSGRMAARRTRAALGPQGLLEQTHLRFRNG